jgi:hypothetical protein
VVGADVRHLEEFADVGVVRITLQILDEVFRKIVGSANPKPFEEFKSLVKNK